MSTRRRVAPDWSTWSFPRSDAATTARFVGRRIGLY
jgi:hypothetical protein